MPMVAEQQAPPRGALVDVEAIRAASPISEVVAEHVRLRRTGAQLIGLCPFHSEKTPSFTVHPAKQLFFCHGCGAGGDVFDFIEMLQDCPFREAARHLATRAGIRDFDQEGLARVKAERDRQRRAAEVLVDMEHAAWREMQDAVLGLEAILRVAGARLDAIHRGEREHFAGEAELAWSALAEVHRQMPGADAAYRVASFAAPPERYAFALHPERRAEMIEAALSL
jgi:hypothetical protein